MATVHVIEKVFGSQTQVTPFEQAHNRIVFWVFGQEDDFITR